MRVEVFAFQRAAVEEIEFDEVVAPIHKLLQLPVNAGQRAGMRGVERMASVQLPKRLARSIFEQNIAIGVKPAALDFATQIVAPIGERRPVNARLLAVLMDVPRGPAPVERSSYDPRRNPR